MVEMTDFTILLNVGSRTMQQTTSSSICTVFLTMWNRNFVIFQSKFFFPLGDIVVNYFYYPDLATMMLICDISHTQLDAQRSVGILLEQKTCLL